MNRRRRVDAGDPADVVRARPRAPRRHVGADIEPDRHAQAEELPVRVERELCAGDVVAAVLVGDEAFATVGGPLHRPPETLRRPEHEHVLGIRAAPHPEAAANFAGDDTEMAVRHAEDLIGEQRA